MGECHPGLCLFGLICLFVGFVVLSKSLIQHSNQRTASYPNTTLGDARQFHQIMRLYQFINPEFYEVGPLSRQQEFLYMFYGYVLGHCTCLITPGVSWSAFIVACGEKKLPA